MDSKEFFTRKASGLVRQLSASDVLMFNVLNMGIAWTFLYIVYGPLIYPGVNMPVTILIAAPLIFVISLTFLLFSVAMPRSGGDYVWVSRAIHPAIAFMSSFLLTIIMLSFLGPVGGWIIDPGIKSILISVGTITNNPALIEQAISISTPVNMFIAALIVTAVIVAVNFAGTKNVWRWQWCCFIFVILGALIFIITAFTVGREVFITRFNALSGANYFDIIEAAKSAGYNVGFTISGTLLGSVYAFLNFYGFQWSTYVGGEVKDVGRSQVIAIIGSVVIFAAFAFASFMGSYVMAGSEFVHAAAYLWGTGNNAWTLPSAPWSSYLISFATDNPWVAALVGFSIIASVFGALTTCVIYGTRVIFAWSFDRIIPTAFAQVDKRHVPRNALLLVFLIGVIYSYLAFFTEALSFLSYEILGMWMATGIIGIAAVLFPYRRKDIFEKSPRMVQAKVYGVPLISIFGVITTITGFSVAIFTVAPQFTGAPVNPYYLGFIILTMMVALAIYVIAYLYNQRRGIDMNIGFREIPPA